MLTLASGARMFMATRPVDLRRSYDGLCAIVVGHETRCSHTLVHRGAHGTADAGLLPSTRRARFLHSHAAASSPRHSATNAAHSSSVSPGGKQARPHARPAGFSA